MFKPDPPVLALFLPLAVTLLLLLVRGIRLRLALAKVPVRIHVGGTRGKSSVCRLIASGLRASGIKTLAKTTGTDPLLWLPDGSARPWRRVGPASIAEQRRFALLASRLNARATVLECMAIRPDLVRASECDLVRATLAVITNVRLDHLEDTPSLEVVSESCLGMVPRNGVLVVSEEALSPDLRNRARARRTAIVTVPTAGLSAAEANRAIARTVCEALGVGAPMPESDEQKDDAGAFALSDQELGGKRFRFANAFACNDTVSLDLLWRQYGQGPAPLVALLNHRGDRPLRSLQFLDYFATLPHPPLLLLVGSTLWLRMAARRRGLELRVLSSPPWLSPMTLIGRIAATIPEGAMVWGVGNYHGRGAAIVKALRQRVACLR